MFRITSKMDNQNEHYRHIMLFYFKEGKNAKESCKKICAVYGEDVIKERVCQKWFARFRRGDFLVQDAPRRGRPVEVDDDKVKVLVDTNPHYTTREIARILQISKTSVKNHLDQLGYVNRLDVWVPHELNEAHLIERISISDSLRRRVKCDPFLQRMVTGAEKCIIYNKRVITSQETLHRRRDGSTQLKIDSKMELYPSIVMLSIWWDWKGIVLYELFPRDRINNLDCTQLDKVNIAIREKRPELTNHKDVVFHYDATSHMSFQTRKKLLELDWDVISHPPHSPDLAPSDYYLFPSLQSSLNEQHFASEEAIKCHLEQFFAEKDSKFFERGIMQLSERWQKIVDQSGQYIVE